jgi:hypothetical protein
MRISLLFMHLSSSQSVFDDKLDDQLTLQDSIGGGEWVHLMTAGPL